MKIAIVLLSFCPAISCGCQAIVEPDFASYPGMGAYSKHHIDAFSFPKNQAALASIKTISVGLYGEREYLLPELGIYELVAVLPTSSGNIGLEADYNGFSQFNEMRLGLAYARKLGTKADVGVQFNYDGIGVVGYGNASTIIFAISTILHLADNLNAGLHIFNPVGGKLGKNQEEKLASIYSAGFGYEPSEKFYLEMEIKKTEGRPASVNLALQYQFLPQLAARAGIQSVNGKEFFGIEFAWQNMRMDATANYHPKLGITPGLLLSVDLKTLDP